MTKARPGTATGTRRCTWTAERWTLGEPFAIAGLVQRDTELVVVEIEANGQRGRGECERDDLLSANCPNVLAEMERARPAIERGATRMDLLDLLPAGPARSAIDCALWDLESKLAGEPVWALAGVPEPRPLTTAYTLSVASPEQMAAAARREAHRPLLKLKLEGGKSSDCIRAVRDAVPSTKLIADANGSIPPERLTEVIATCAQQGVALLEQPLPRRGDDALASVSHEIAICADESFHDRLSVPDILGKYDMVNVKLDKTGGLTEALLAIAAVQRRGLRIMVGCMLGTSLAMAPAFLLASQADYADLDGPLLLGTDRPGGMRFDGSTLYPPAREFWGCGKPLIIDIPKPYLLFLGDVEDELLAKTAFGIRDWCRADCVGQHRLHERAVNLGLVELTPEQAQARGARTMVIGVANSGGYIPETWVPSLVAAVNAGLDIAAGMHQRLADIPAVAAGARRAGVELHDVRQPRETFPVGSGQRRTGKRLLTVGTDCAVGKKYTALAIDRELRRRGVKSDFRATGQTGLLIAGRGIVVDAVVSDFVAGAAEALSPVNRADHWDVVEGQGSLFHPSYAGVTLGLIHGTQPDALVVCHDPLRKHLDEMPDFQIPDVAECAVRHVEAARLTNPRARCVGVSVNTSKMTRAAAVEYEQAIAARMGVPCVDPMRDGVSLIAEYLLESA